MFRDRAVEIRIKAAEATLERIRADHHRVTAQLQPILKYVENELFSHKLQIKSLRRKLGIRDESHSRRFGEELGLTPWAYITDCRMEVAARMLLNSDLKPWRIGTALGYASGDSFGRAFKRWSRQTPEQYRKDPRKRVEAERLEEDLLSPEEIIQALAGELSLDRTEILLRRLELVRDQILATYPRLRTPPATPAPRPVLGAEFIESSMAESLWKQVENLPADEMRATVAAQVAFSTPALFKLLEQKSYDAAHTDVERSVAIAELLPDVLEPIAANLGLQLPNFKSDAWATIAHARLRAGDEAGADKALEMAEKGLQLMGGGGLDPMVLLKVLIGQSALRLRQGHVEQAEMLMREQARLVTSMLSPPGSQAPPE